MAVDEEDFENMAERLKALEAKVARLTNPLPPMYFTEEQALRMAEHPTVQEGVIREVVKVFGGSDGQLLTRSIERGHVHDELWKVVQKYVTVEMLGLMEKQLAEQVERQLNSAVATYFREPTLNQPAGPGWTMLGTLSSSLLRRAIRKGLGES